MGAGRPRKPHHLHELEGTGREDRGTATTPETPNKNSPFSHEEWLTGEIPTREEVFDRLTVWCKHFGLESQAEEMGISMFAETYHAYIQAQALVRDEGITAKLGPTLAVYVVNGLRKEVTGFMKSFGMTLETRHILNPTVKEDDDPVEALFIKKS